MTRIKKDSQPLTPTQQKLVTDSMRLIHRIIEKARRGLPYNVLYEDLYSAGCLGLCEAAVKFDPERGVKFSTFAYFRVLGAVVDCVRKQLGVTNRTRTHANLTEYLGDRELIDERSTHDVAMEAGRVRRAIETLNVPDRALLHGLLNEETGEEWGRKNGIGKSWVSRKRTRMVGRLRSAYLET